MDLWEEILEVQIDILGEFHPGILITKMNKGVALLGEERVKEGMILVEQTYNDKMRSLGEER